MEMKGEYRRHGDVLSLQARDTLMLSHLRRHLPRPLFPVSFRFHVLCSRR